MKFLEFFFMGLILLVPVTVETIRPELSVTTSRKYQVGEIEKFKVVASAPFTISATAHLTIKVAQVYPNGDADLVQTNDIKNHGEPGLFSETEDATTKVDRFGISREYIPFNELSWAHLEAVLPKAIHFKQGQKLEVTKRAELKGYCYWHTITRISSTTANSVTFQSKGEHHDGSGYPPGDSKVSATATWNLHKHRYDKIILDETYIDFRNGSPFTVRMVYTRE